MNRAPLWKISIVTTLEAEEAVTELLEPLLQQPAVSYTDVETLQTTVATYVSGKPDRRSLNAALNTGLARIRQCGLKTGRATVLIERIRRQDWAESWKRHFKPIEISRTLLIKPGWSRRRAKQNQAVVILDPGLSFGTGQHPTTAFCLQQLAARRDERVRQSFLDIGTGSGILAIAAAKLGYTPVDAFDFDADAVPIARANARRNRMLERIHFRHADLTKLPVRSARKYDLICANLIANVLLSERRRI